MENKNKSLKNLLKLYKNSSFNFSKRKSIIDINHLKKVITFLLLFIFLEISDYAKFLGLDPQKHSKALFLAI